MLRASLQRDPGVEGADQSCPCANAGIVQCFRLSCVVGRGNVLVSRYLRPRSIADTLSITLFKSIGYNSIDILKISAINYRQYSILRYWQACRNHIHVTVEGVRGLKIHLLTYLWVSVGLNVVTELKLCLLSVRDAAVDGCLSPGLILGSALPCGLIRQGNIIIITILIIVISVVLVVQQQQQQQQ